MIAHHVFRSIVWKRSREVVVLAHCLCSVLRCEVLENSPLSVDGSVCTSMGA